VSFGDYLANTERLLTLTYDGFNRVILMPQIHGILQEGTEMSEEQLALRERGKERAELARREIDSDFPLLHAHALLGMWSALETCIEDLSAAWISYKPETLKLPAFVKLRIPLAEYEGLPPAERAAFVVGELERDLKVDLKAGATRFEALLGAIGLGGELDRRVGKSLFQTQQIRNVLAHRAGVVDRVLVERCPDLKLIAGSTIRIGRELFVSSVHGMSVYAVTVRNRCASRSDLGIRHLDLPGFERATRMDSLSDGDEGSPQPNALLGTRGENARS
jgi:hypothetical protein